MGRRRAKANTTSINYEDLRAARILENQARLASLGIQKSIADLRSIASLVKPKRLKPSKNASDDAPLRRSVRLLTRKPNPKPVDVYQPDSHRLRGKKHRLRQRKYSSSYESSLSSNFSTDDGSISGEVESRVSTRSSISRCANKPLVNNDQIYGVCCYFCRLKELCDEEDCKRCRNLDSSQPCLGKTECSLCHSGNGVLCRPCLKSWCSEDIGDVRENTDWICPCCLAETRQKPYWICKRFHLFRRFIYEEAKNDTVSSSNLQSSGDEIQLSDISVNGDEIWFSDISVSG